ncbi:MAG TPA: hypothetical protein VMS98_17090 [Thermoanaerobaculia bacterium]|nr:hypothetical protein [Thermoanaerobaculia bacterium]
MALILAGALALTLSAQAAPTQRSLIVTSQDHSLVDSDDCEHFHTRNLTSLPALARSEEERQVPLLDVKILRVRTSEGGGVSVKGWDRPFARLTVCKSAMALSEDAARRALQSISVAVDGGDITAFGPGSTASQTWWVHMILNVPRDKHLDVEAANGGIAIRNMQGAVTARSTNGGISLASCAGENKVTTLNGGISLDRISGTIDATSRKGSISYKLRSVAVPVIEARTEDSGEILCNLKGCTDGLGDWTADRKQLRIGRGSAPSVRLTSYSADIMIEQVR